MHWETTQYFYKYVGEIEREILPIWERDHIFLLKIFWGEIII